MINEFIKSNEPFDLPDQNYYNILILTQLKLENITFNSFSVKLSPGQGIEIDL